jgi:hypothetical protein
VKNQCKSRKPDIHWTGNYRITRKNSSSALSLRGTYVGSRPLQRPQPA